MLLACNECDGVSGDEESDVNPCEVVGGDSNANVCNETLNLAHIRNCCTNSTGIYVCI